MEGENKETLPLSRHSVIFKEDRADTICMFLKKVGLLKSRKQICTQTIMVVFFCWQKQMHFCCSFVQGVQ